MFILRGLILETGENLLQDFWSPFSISFVCFSARNNLKKVLTDLGPCPARTPPAGGLYIARHPGRISPSRHPRPNPNPKPSRRRLQPPPPAAAATRRRRRGTLTLR